MRSNRRAAGADFPLGSNVMAVKWTVSACGHLVVDIAGFRLAACASSRSVCLHAVASRFWRLEQ